MTEVSEGTFEKAMSWRAALSLAVTLPAIALTVIGYWIGALGAWTAVTLLALSSIMAIAQNFVYAELASMFPKKSGGIALYAFEAWKRVSRWVGALAAAGYWAGWSFGLAANAIVVGQLVHAQWFSGATMMGPLGLTLGHGIAVVVLFGVWALNVFGIRPAVWFSYVSNGLVMTVMLAAVVVAIVTGRIDLSTLTWSLDSSAAPAFLVACVWMFLMGWTVYGTEVAATFAPEYRSPRRDVPKALAAAGVTSLAVFVIMPLVAAGTLGEPEIGANPLEFNVTLFDTLFGGAGALAILVLCVAMLNLMSVATADSGRALHGMATSGLTVRQLGVLNRARVPARAMTVGLVINLFLVIFVGNLIGVIFASNIGYMIAVIAALSGYLLLRRAQAHPERAFRLPRVWNVIAFLLMAANLMFLVVSAANRHLTGYGGWTELFVGVGVLALALVMYVYRRYVQDRQTRDR